ncbi:beta-1,3-galactosyltransferase 1-like [Gigantopelta aegis]|uniref:beta-1,3-galactosyltransferase 1-like n=1 Tax=Gigantopelta aegis TaxID=1735272 RepID=UPI001B88B14A|nr:beta-1,3-galactosyltransferase 1-like [Gigantopelta aegis]
MFPRFSTVYRYTTVIVLLLVSAFMIMQFSGNRTDSGDDIMRSVVGSERSVLSTKSLRTATSIHKHTTEINRYGKGNVANPHSFRYVLNPVKLCTGNDIFIITYVHSAPKNLKKRQTIRQTWGSGTYFLTQKVRVVFIMGQVADKHVMESVRMESDLYGDIVQEDFLDSYHNLTYKALAGLKWVSTFCRHTAYVLKTDDDIFVNVFVLMKYIQSTVELSYGRTNLILCNQWIHMKVMRDKRSKWYIPKEDFSPDYFPPYCSGSAYLMSSDVTEGMYRLSLTTPFFWVDDYYITGLLVHKLNLTHRRYNSAYVLNPSVVLEKFKNDEDHKYAFFHTHKLKTMFYLWTTVISNESKAVHTKNSTTVSTEVNQNMSRHV